jgi:hypothetical protein
MTIEHSKNSDQTGEVNKPEKQSGDDSLKKDRTVDNKVIEKKRAIAAQDFSVSDIDTEAIKQANEARKNAFQLVDDGAVVAASKRPNAALAPDSHATASDSRPPSETARSVLDAITAKHLHDLASISPELKRVTADCSAHMTPDQQKKFVGSLEAFQKRTDLSQAEKDGVYAQLGKLLEAKDTKLAGADKERRDYLRLTLAGDLIYHAAHPSRTDQGSFNTCNVTTQAERLFTRNPSIAAELAVTTALTGEWVNPQDHKVIKIDRESLRPSQMYTTTTVPPDDGVRAYDIQIINNVMVNDATQREIPPRKYVQGPAGWVTAPGGKQHFDNGERQYLWDPVDDKCLSPITKPDKHADGSITLVNVSSPDLNNKQISDIGTRLTGESHYFIEPFPLHIDPLTKKPIDDGLVHIDSADKLRETLREMKLHHRLPAIIYVDAHSPLFERNHRFPPGSAHVVSIRDYDDATGRVRISNQWGSKDDIQANVGDLYDCCHLNYRKADDFTYEYDKFRVQTFGNVQPDTTDI